MTDENPAHYALRILLETFPFWLPIAVLMFGLGKSRHWAWRLVFLALSALVLFALFYGPVMLGRNVNGPIMVAALGAVVGLSLGFGFRRRPRPIAPQA